MRPPPHGPPPQGPPRSGPPPFGSPPHAPLPALVGGSRSPLWWGVLMLVVIEATVFATLIATYFYLRLGAPEWPPAGIGRPELLLSTISNAALLASAAPAFVAERAIRRGDRGLLLLGLAAGMALAAGYPVLKVIELNDQPYSWATNVYGSVVWTINGYSMLHVITLLLLAAVVFALGWRGHFTERRFVGVQATALYWYFVALGSVPLYATVYLAPYVL